MADYTEIIQEINTNLPDNNNQSITAAKLRTTLTDMLGAIDDVQQEFEGDVENTLSTFVVNDLTSTDTDKALSANQGYELASVRDTFIIDGQDSALIRQARVPVQPGHTYKLTINNTDISIDNFSYGSGYSKLYVYTSTKRTYTEGGTTSTLINVLRDDVLKPEYEFTIPKRAEGEDPFNWLEIQMRFDAGQEIQIYLEDVTALNELDDKINPQVITLSKSTVAEYTLEYSNKFPVCKYSGSQGSDHTSDAYVGLFKRYAIGKNWSTLLESGTNSGHRTYRIPVDPEKYVMCSVRMYGSSSSASSAPLACLVDENDIVVACITNNLGNGAYWTGNIIPKTAKYLIMPYWVSDTYLVNVAFIPKSNFVSQNEEAFYSSIPSSSNITFDMFEKSAPVFGGVRVYDSAVVYGRYGNLGKYTVDDLLTSYFGSSSGHIYKLFYVEGYDSMEFYGFNTTSYPGFYFVFDRDGNCIDQVNNPVYYYNNYQFPANACFVAYRSTDIGYANYPTIRLVKNSLKPLQLPVLPLQGISLTPGKLGENGELNNLSANEIYWTTSYIDLSKGFTIKVNDGFQIMKGVLYNTNGKVVNPFFFDQYSSTYTFYSLAQPYPGYMLRLTIGVANPSSRLKPITKYDSVIKFFTYLDNPDLTKVIPADKPYEAYKRRLYKLTNISEIARYDQWIDKFNSWSNTGKSIPMTSNEGEGQYWNTRYREGWDELGTLYSEASEYNYYVGQNISLKTFVTAIQNKRSVMYTERINSTAVNNTTIGTKVSKYGYTYRGLNSHYCASFYGTVCTGLTGYLMGQDNIYISGDYMRRNASNTGPRIPNLQMLYSKYYSDTVTQAQWDEMIDALQPMDFIWQPGHCVAVSDIYKDYNGVTQLIVITEQARPFTNSRAYTREQFQIRYQNILNQGSGNGFGILRYNDWENAHLDDYYDDNDYFAINNWRFKSNIQIDPDITTFRGEYVTFQIGEPEALNDYRAYLNIHRGVNKYNYLQIYYEDDTEMTTALKQIGISASETYPSDTLYPEDAYDQEDWIIFDLTDAEKMDGVLDAGLYKARLYNSNDGTYSGFTHFEFVDFTFSASLDGTSIKASWSNFSDNATPCLIRQERSTGMCFTEGSEYPSSQNNRSGQTYIYTVDTDSATDQTVFTLSEDSAWDTNVYTKIIVRGTYGCVSRRIKTIN